jgi:D-glycero-alpha-D-manno-heptose 1-phosphate guanylyltransferase
MFDAVVLAGGLGTRLRSVVSDVPKCMAPVNGRPFLEWLLAWIEPFRPDKIILSLGYLSEVVTDWVDTNMKDYTIPIEWVIEETPLGTGGGIRLALSKVTSNQCVILNGDTFFDVDLNAFCLSREQAGSALAVALKPMERFDRYGSVTINADGRIASFNEKRYCDKGLINGGIYCIDCNAGLFNDKPEKFSFEKDVLEPQSSMGLISGFISDGSFIDIGIPQDYSLAQTFLPANINL